MLRLDVVGHLLELVVPHGALAVEARVHQPVHVLGQLLGRVVGLEAVEEGGQLELVEAGQRALVAHRLHQERDAGQVRAQREQPLEQRALEEEEEVGGGALHQLHVVLLSSPWSA